MFDAIGRGLEEALLDIAIDQIIDLILGALAGLGGTGNSLFGGARQRGGPVLPGHAYLVGERRPELFVPNQAGVIIPNANGATAGPTIIIEVHGIVRGDSDIVAIAETVSQRVSRANIALNNRARRLGRV